MKFLAVFVAVLAMSAAAPRFSTWDINELSEAISSPNTDPALLPYLNEALNTLMEAMFAGTPITAVPVVTPAGVLPSPSEALIVPDVAAEVAPVEAVAPAAPVAPAAVAEASSGSPLVQIIVNVNADSAPAAVVAPTPVADSIVAPTPVAESIVAPTPVSVVDHPIAVSPVAVVETPIAASPVAVVEQPAVVVDPVIVVEEPVIVTPVGVVEQPIEPIAVGEPTLPEISAPINPIDVIAVAAPDANPIDIIAVAAPDVNPIDIISPVPAVVGVVEGGIIV